MKIELTRKEAEATLSVFWDAILSKSWDNDILRRILNKVYFGIENEGVAKIVPLEGKE